MGSEITVTLLGTVLRRRSWSASSDQASWSRLETHDLLLFDSWAVGALPSSDAGWFSFENRVDALFLTTCLDHVVGIPDLWLLAALSRRGKPFPVFAQSGTAAMMG